MKTLDLQILQQGKNGLTPLNAGFLVEAASICLHHNGHVLSADLTNEGYYNKLYRIHCAEVNSGTINSYKDLQEATEYGACAIALAIMLTEEDWIIQRAVKGDGFDYWLGQTEETLPFQNKARLEVSGILTGTDTQMNSRLEMKLAQTKVSDRLGIPAFAVIVEFGSPKTLIGRRDGFTE